MKYAPTFVSLIGILGLALGLTYLVAIGLAFTPGYDELTHFLVGESDLEFSYNFLWVGLPYLLLIAHLYMRTQLGLWMLDRGMVAEARAYVMDKQETGLMRSSREVAHHWLAMSRILACEGEYDAAWEKLEEHLRRGKVPGSLRGRWAHWAMEVALRREDGIGFTEVSERIDIPLNDRVGAAVWSCRAEYHARARNYVAFREAVESSNFAWSSHPRLAHARAVGALRIPERVSDPAAIHRELISARSELLDTHPFLDPECAALEAYLEALQDPSNFTADVREELHSFLEQADSRAAFVVKSVLREADARAEEN